MAGSRPAAPPLAPLGRIRPSSPHQCPHASCRIACRPIYPGARTSVQTPSNRPARRSQPFPRRAPWSNPHSARTAAGCPTPAISCLGAFRTPASSVRAWSRHGRHPKTCTDSAAPRARPGQPDLLRLPTRTGSEPLRSERYILLIEDRRRARLCAVRPERRVGDLIPPRCRRRRAPSRGRRRRDCGPPIWRGRARRRRLSPVHRRPTCSRWLRRDRCSP